MSIYEQWFMNHDNVYGLAEWMVDENEVDTPNDLLRIFEKPWKYELAWERYQAERDNEAAKAIDHPSF